MIALNTITFIHLFTFFVVLFFRKENSLPNKLLGLLLIVPGLNFISNVFVLLDIIKYFPYIYFFVQATMYMFAPMVFYYTYLMTGSKPRLTHPLFIISSVFMLMVVGFAIEFGLMNNGAQEIYIQGIMYEPYPYQMEIANTLFILMQLVYFSFAGVRVFRYRKHLHNTYSNQTKTKIEFTIKFISLIWILNLLSIIGYATFETITVEYILLPLVLVFIYSFIFYYAFKNNTIFSKLDYEKFEAYQQILKEKPIYVSTDNYKSDRTHLILKKNRKSHPR